MKLRVILNSGTVIYPVFDPEHSEAILALYQAELESFGIQAYEVITN
jgi:hypothetical protein